LTPTELTGLIRARLEERFSDLWVEGEVGSLRAPGSGHIYFNLKDASCQIKGIIYRSHGRFLRFIPREGQAVLIRGHLSLYEPRGECQLVVDYIEPKGTGALQAAFQALKERLSAEGLFDPSRKRPLPLLPRKIGIVTSPTGAALRDILKVLKRRFFGLSVLIAPVSVQGPGAADQIADAIDEMGNRGDLDLLILARGGGSLEDLFAFNEEAVARAIARSPLPIVSAVGHETDFTIADFVADLRAPTPSAAAEMVVPNREDRLEEIAGLEKRLIYLMKQRLKIEGRRLESELRLLQAPDRRLSQQSNRVEELSLRLSRQIRRITSEFKRTAEQTSRELFHLDPRFHLSRLRDRLLTYSNSLAKGLPGMGLWEARLQRAVAELSALSPLAILSRGYSIAKKLPGGEIIREADLLSRDDRVAIRFHRGEAECRVERTLPTTQERNNSF
jgi:exodeoxyribonuclease VII large subunit